MRRKDRAIPVEESIHILTTGEFGVLSTVDAERLPYGVPLNYVFMDNCIYFHAAYLGHKIDNIANNPQVSFCVVGKTQVVSEKYTSLYESVICFGKASLVEEKEKLNALIWLLEKYAPKQIGANKKTMSHSLDSVAVIKLTIEHFTGKAQR